MKAIVAAAMIAVVAIKMPPARAAVCGPELQPGQKCECQISRLRPTQLAIGRLHVERIKHDNSVQDLQDRARGDDAPRVIAVGNDLFVVDGHHHTLALIEELGTAARTASTTCEMSERGTPPGLDPANDDVFWREMAKNKDALLEPGDSSGGKARSSRFPNRGWTFEDDPYRSLASFIKESCKLKMGGDYAQFAWAALLRKYHYPPPTTYLQRQEQGRQAIQQIIDWEKDPQRTTEVGNVLGSDRAGAVKCAKN